MAGAIRIMVYLLSSPSPSANPEPYHQRISFRDTAWWTKNTVKAQHKASGPSGVAMIAPRAPKGMMFIKRAARKPACLLPNIFCPVK